jgi:hypothetical protein
MRSSMIPAALAIGVMAVAAAPAAAQSPGYGPPTGWTNGAAPGDYYQYQDRRARGSRPYVDVPYAGGGWVPYSQRGFDDPGYAYHGNHNGCVVDLGYGRWEQCSGGR